MRNDDQILILEDGKSKEYDKAEVLFNCTESQVFYFIKSKEFEKELMEPLTAGAGLKLFQEKYNSVMNSDIKSAQPNIKAIQNKVKLAQLAANNRQLPEDTSYGEKFEPLVMKFLTSVSLKESIFICTSVDI